MPTCRTRTAGLISAAVIATGALTGCSATGVDDGTTTSPEPRGASSTSTVTSPPSEPAPAPTLVATASGASASCVAGTTTPDLVGMHDPVARAQGDLTITGVRAVGRKVRLVASEGVVVTSRPSFGPGIQLSDTWPLTGRLLRTKTDLSTRQQLRGMELTDGQRVLPLFRVRVARGATLDALELTYVGGEDEPRRVTLPVGTRFVGGACPP